MKRAIQILKNKRSNNISHGYPVCGYSQHVASPANQFHYTTAAAILRHKVRCVTRSYSTNTSSGNDGSDTRTVTSPPHGISDHSDKQQATETSEDLSHTTTHTPIVVGDGMAPAKKITEADFNRAFPHRKKTDFSERYTENKAITKRRALREYYLRLEDIQDLPSIAVFNPYGTGSRITELYLQSDVERKALSVWGSRENLEREGRLRAIQDQYYSGLSPQHWAAALGPSQYPGSGGAHPLGSGSGTDGAAGAPPPWWEHFAQGSGRVVKWAVLINFGNFLAKLVAWRITNSHSMFAEMVHSAADTLNQVILAIGLHQSIKQPDPDHPYGYSNINEIRHSSRHNNMTFSEYVMRGTDPHVNVVLLEDLAAVLGAGVAAACLTVSYLRGTSLADAAGCCVVGATLASVAAVIIYTNSLALVGRSMPDEKQNDIVETLEADRCVRSVLDVKTVDVGNNCYRFKAEIFFDGREIARSYLDDDVTRAAGDAMLRECQRMRSGDDLHAFILRHGDQIVDKVGEHTKRIETRLKQNHPQVRHVDLEAIGRGTQPQQPQQPHPQPPHGKSPA